MNRNIDTRSLNIELSIESVELQGVQGNPERIREAVKLELAKQLAQQRTAISRNRNHDVMQLKPRKLGDTPETLATQLAQQICNGLTGN